MRMYTSEERSHRRSLNQQMLSLVERHLSGTVTRVELEVWARANRGPFTNGEAESMHTCLYNLGDMVGDEPLIRRVDLEEHVHAMRFGGGVRIDSAPIAEVALSIEEVGERTALASTRWCLDGIGWFESVRLVSLLTGRTFLITKELAVNVKQYAGCFVTTHALPDAPQERAYVLSDLRESSGMDESVCKSLV